MSSISIASLTAAAIGFGSQKVTIWEPCFVTDPRFIFWCITHYYIKCQQVLAKFSLGCITVRMPNKRSPDQELVTLWMDTELLSGIEEGRRKLRGVARSQFIRDAIQTRLDELGIRIPDEKVIARDRARKHSDSRPALPDLSSKSDDAAAKAARKAAEWARQQTP